MTTQRTPNQETTMAKRAIPKTCHCGSGKLPGIMRERGWCCAVCHNDRQRCQGDACPRCGVRSAIHPITCGNV